MAKWVIAGGPGGALPEVGRTYEVRHSRKGTFSIKVTKVSGEWLTGWIVTGVAKAMMEYNVAYEGDEITIRDSMSYLIERAP